MMNRSNLKTLVLLFVCLFFGLSRMQGQGFKASALLGFTASQIDGDNLAGFDKLGLTGGVRITRDINTRYFAGLELIASQRGSQSQITLGTPSDQSRTHLDYIEIPFLFGINDWLSETGDFYKVKAELGISYGYLFNSSSTNIQFIEQIEDFRPWILSYSLGAGYTINKRWSATARYTRDFTNLLETGLKSYFWTFRMEFNL